PSHSTFFSFSCSRHPRDLPSFPTRRSSDLSFELIEIPHVRISGKNSADIRLVVDALDLCYTKSHVDTFVIISGDSDFSPLVSKLDRKSTRLNSSHVKISYAVFCLKKKNNNK